MLVRVVVARWYLGRRMHRGRCPTSKGGCVCKGGCVPKGRSEQLEAVKCGGAVALAWWRGSVVAVWRSLRLDAQQPRCVAVLHCRPSDESVAATLRRSGRGPPPCSTAAGELVRRLGRRRIKERVVVCAVEANSAHLDATSPSSE